MKLDGCFSHNTDNWKTPSELMKALLELGWIDTFPFMSVYDEFQKTITIKSYLLIHHILK